jgi:hypothetical protein
MFDLFGHEDKLDILEPFPLALAKQFIDFGVAAENLTKYLDLLGVFVFLQDNIFLLLVDVPLTNQDLLRHY